VTRTAQDFLVAALGALTSLLTTLVLVVVDQRLDFSFYTLTIWFVVPVGAICSGFAAASGYYAGSRLFNHRPTPLLLWNMISFAVGTFFLIHYFEFYFLTVHGKLVRDFISFADYLSVVFSHTSLEFRWRGGVKVGEPFELGSLGYLYAALQVLGFCVGGIFVYFHLKSQPYCEDCGKYLVKKFQQTRYSNLPDEFIAVTRMLMTMFAQCHFQPAVFVHGSTMSATISNATLSSTLEVKRCKQCNKHWLKFSVHKLVGNNWREVDDLGYKAFTSEPVSNECQPEASAKS